MTGALKVLVVDDERLSRITTVKQLQAGGYEAESVDSPFAALERLAEGSWDIVLTDLRMPGMDGLAFLARLKEEHSDVEVILMTAYGTVETAVEAMRQGAADYLTKPFRFEELDLRFRRIQAHKQAQAELQLLRGMVADQAETFGLVGRSAGIQQVRERIRSFAGHAAPVLVTGETGTGKELVARAIHQAGERRKAEFVAVGCGTIPRELAESELFGHEKGAFTGAARRRAGSFELADGGTLLLDDIDDLPLELQVKLLRILQEGTFTRVGSSQEQHVDVRVIATSKVDLEQAVARKSFRSDLFYRLRGLEIHLPPLCERGDDVIILAGRFLQMASATEGRGQKHLVPEAAEILRSYPWPGNVRELRRAMESAYVLSPGEEITPAFLPDFLHRSGGEGAFFSLHLDRTSEVAFNDLLHSFERAVLDWGLRKAGGRQAEAARLLGLPRTTLQSKLGHAESQGGG